MHKPKDSLLYSGMATGVISVSLATIFIRMAEAPPLIIASYRLSIAAVVTVAIAICGNLRPKEPGGKQIPNSSLLNKADFLLLAISAGCLALHFAFWITSLGYTSIASSVMLVTTSPFMVAITSRFIFNEPLYLRVMLGVGLGILGGLVLTIGDAGEEGMLFGNLLAFLGAVTIVGYLLAGRRLRKHIPTLTYAAWVYSGAAIILMAMAMISGQSFTGFSLDTYVAMLLLALVPQVIGHSLLNWSLAYVSATLVAITVMAEPMIATLLAIPMLGEWPSQTTIAGGVCILIGIYLAVRPVR